ENLVVVQGVRLQLLQTDDASVVVVERGQGGTEGKVELARLHPTAHAEPGRARRAGPDAHLARSRPAQDPAVWEPHLAHVSRLPGCLECSPRDRQQGGGPTDPQRCERTQGFLPESWADRCSHCAHYK